MRRIVPCSVLAVAVSWLLAAPSPGFVPAFDPRTELDGRQCRDLGGVLVVDVSQRVQNDADSGFSRPVWALDDYTRYVKIYRVGASDLHCIVNEYKNGVFVATEGPSPQGTDPLIADGLTGTFFGGYRAFFHGTMAGAPGLKTRGFIGTYDYACDETGSCPGYVDLIGAYFPGYTGFAFDWWGWKYAADLNGSVWINACTGPDSDCPGSSGDITD